MLGASGIRGDEGQVHIGLGHAGKVAFRFLGGLLQTLVRHLILAKVDAVGLLEVIGHVVEQALIKVIAAQVVVAGIDDTLDLQTGNLAGVLGGLALGIGEVGRNGNDCFGDLFAQVALGIGLQLLQDHRGNFLRGVLLAIDVHLVIGAHVTLDGRDGLFGVGDSLALSHLAYQTLIVFECYNRRGRAGALAIGDDDGFAAFHNCYAAVCCT